MSSVVIRSTDRRAMDRAVHDCVRRLKRQHPEISTVIWFGSWVTGIPCPGSDVDLCLILSSSDCPFRERIARYLPERFPVGIDLFPYTEAELERLRRDNPGWHAQIMSGKVVAGESDAEA
ncbi:MAG: nucleotidyltransferase domain-containing protein [Acidobacteria bacterium]|nr:nucleotidyltransferase domain-containing protein [Acidobacteriota bacterium]